MGRSHASRSMHARITFGTISSKVTGRSWWNSRSCSRSCERYNVLCGRSTSTCPHLKCALWSYCCCVLQCDGTMELTIQCDTFFSVVRHEVPPDSPANIREPPHSYCRVDTVRTVSVMCQ